MVTAAGVCHNEHYMFYILKRNNDLAHSKIREVFV